MNRLQPYAQLVRLPNLPTALADIALGRWRSGRGPSRDAGRSTCC